MDERARRGLVIGLVLILVGIGLFVQQFLTGWASETLIVALIGAAFLIGYFVTRKYGLLIPACILLGIALGTVGKQAAELAGSDRWGGFFQWGDLSVVGLGIGFVAIYVIDRIYRGSSHWWPLIPGGILIFVGLGLLSEKLAQVLAVAWPLALVLVGLLLLLGAFGVFGRKKNPSG